MSPSSLTEPKGHAEPSASLTQGSSQWDNMARSSLLFTSVGLVLPCVSKGIVHESREPRQSFLFLTISSLPVLGCFAISLPTSKKVT